MAERIKVQNAAWCHFYWIDLNPGAKKFYQKLLDRAFSQVLLHKIGDCTWDSNLKVITSPSTQTEMSAIAEFEQQDWVKLLSQGTSVKQQTKVHLNPNVVFPFQDDFLVRTIHGTNVQASTPGAAAAPTATEVMEIQDDNEEVSVLTAKTTSKAQSDVVVGKPGCLQLQPHQRPDHCLYPARSHQRRIGTSHQQWLGRWSRRWAKGQIVITDPSFTSAEGGISKVQGELSSGQETSRCRRSQQHALGHRQKEAASRQHQLLSTCMKLKK